MTNTLSQTDQVRLKSGPSSLLSRSAMSPEMSLVALAPQRTSDRAMSLQRLKHDLMSLCENQVDAELERLHDGCENDNCHELCITISCSCAEDKEEAARAAAAAEIQRAMAVNLSDLAALRPDLVALDHTGSALIAEVVIAAQQRLAEQSDTIPLRKKFKRSLCFDNDSSP